MMPNKHGFTGVRKRTDGRAKPYYARFRFNGGYLYTKSHTSADQAADEYQKHIATRTALRRSPTLASPEETKR